jgi:DNA transformation protein
MFALVADDALYLKVDDRNRPDFEAAGMTPFSYERRGKTATLKSYYEAPPELPDDAEDLSAWASKAFGAALASAKPKR